MKMDIQMEEYSTLAAESGRAFQLPAKLKRESSFPFGAMFGRRASVAGGPVAQVVSGSRNLAPGNPDRALGTGWVHAFAPQGQGTAARPRQTSACRGPAARMVKQALIVGWISITAKARTKASPMKEIVLPC
jgi:hypothetical protein